MATILYPTFRTTRYFSAWRVVKALLWLLGALVVSFAVLPVLLLFAVSILPSIW